MKTHLLRVGGGPAAYTPLLAAAAAAGLRVGWLELRPPEPAGASLEAAAAAGSLRAVGAGGGRVVAVKTLRGAPVLADLVREHFRGCALVLLAGEAAEAEAPLLAADGDGWRVTLGSGARRLATAELVAELRRPHAFAVPAAPGG